MKEGQGTGKRLLSAVRIGAYRWDPELNRIIGPGGERELEPLAMEVLTCLLDKPGRAVPLRELLDHAGKDGAAGKQIIARAIAQLRRTFDDEAQSPRYIQRTENGGYRLVAAVSHTAVMQSMRGRSAMPGPLGEGSRRRFGPTAFVAVLVLAVAGLLLALWLVGSRSGSPGGAEPVVSTISIPGEHAPALTWFRSFAISPAGDRIVYAASLDGKSPLYSRYLDRDESDPVDGTLGGYAPFFSPDGRSIGYSSGAFRRIPAEGGTAVEINLGRGVVDSASACWAPNGTLIFRDFSTDALFRLVPGGKVTQLTQVDFGAGERAHLWPHLLPDNRHVVFTVWRGGSINDSDVELLDTETGERRTLVRGGSAPRYLRDGRLLFARWGTLLAIPFDPDRLEPTGPPEAILRGLMTDPLTGAAHYAVADSGTLVYATWDAFNATRGLYWLDENGRFEPETADVGVALTPRLSPDGSRLAITDGTDALHVWIHDLQRGGAERLTTDGTNLWPIWSPDGRRVVFGSERSGPFNLYWKDVDSDGLAERLTRSDRVQIPGSIRPDGKVLAFSEFSPKTGWDIWTLRLKPDTEPRPLLSTPQHETSPAFSPDGRLLAYTSGGRVHVRSLGGAEADVRVEGSAGQDPRWSADGRQLYFRTPKQLMVVPIETRPKLRAGPPVLVARDLPMSVPVIDMPTYDLAPDGRILTLRVHDPAPRLRLEVLAGFGR
ncbi:MAG: hypothetical protein GY716_20480 [bacterium]|nr:hypothetical protein [bacterium]